MRQFEGVCRPGVRLPGLPRLAACKTLGNPRVCSQSLTGLHSIRAAAVFMLRNIQ